MTRRGLPSARRRKILREIPPRRCTAHVVATGAPCPHWAVVGLAVCWHHGGAARQLRERAAERVALAEMITNGARRHPLEVLADAAHGADSLMVKAAEGLGEPLTAEAIVVYVDAMERAATLAGGLLKLGMDWNAQQAIREQGAALARVAREMARILGHDPNDPAVARAFSAALRVVLGRVMPEPPTVTRAIEGRRP